MVERIRSLLAQFPEDEAAIRKLVARDARFSALCDEYRKVVDLISDSEAQVKLLKSVGPGRRHRRRLFFDD